MVMSFNDLVGKQAPDSGLVDDGGVLLHAAFTDASGWTYAYSYEGGYLLG